jgi:membrane protease YdiL (CAAX protease family)
MLTTPSVANNSEATPAARSRKERLLAAALIGAAMGAAMYFPDQDDGSGSILAALSAFAAAALGLTAVDRVRPLARRPAADHARLAFLSIGLGLALGLANLGVNYGVATSDVAVHQGMLERWANVSAWGMIVAEPMMEELVFRLLLMGVVAWLASRFTSSRRTIFLVALGVSATAFGVMHIFYGGISGLLYSLVVAIKAGAAALLLGWIFWRWGLPYSFLAHATANAVHLVLIPYVF